jgi:hypothetical protein
MLLRIIKRSIGETILCLPLKSSEKQKLNIQVSQILHFVPTTIAICGVKTEYSGPKPR